MASIQQNQPQMQPPILTYKYALRVRPEQVSRMNRDQLEKLCLEQMFLLWLIIAIIRNPLAAIASRVIAIDLLISYVEKNVRGTLKDITERSRVYISGEGGIAKRLGIHPNTVSKSFKALEAYRCIERDYVYDETKQREYLDVTITAQTLSRPASLQDKTARIVKEAGKKLTTLTEQTAPQGNISPALTCSSCGSANVTLSCRDCGIAERFSVPEKDTRPSPVPYSTNFVQLSSITTPFGNGNGELSLTNGESTETQKEIVVEGDIERRRSNEEETPPLEQEETPREEVGPDEVLEAWLQKRIGEGRIIYATGLSAYESKYKSKPPGFIPDMSAYIRGERKHMYGTRLRLADGTTNVLAFDLDRESEHEKYAEFLITLARAGAAPMYFIRQNNRGHLEIYFDSPVLAVQAYTWCLQVCPGLSEIEECYPVPAGSVQKKYPAVDRDNSPISWPLYQRIENTVIACRVACAFPEKPEELIEHPGIATDKQGLARLIGQAITPSSLLSGVVVETREETPAPDQEATKLEVEKTPTRISDRDAARIVITAFNRDITWEEVARLCGGLQGNRFCAVWRDEDKPSVVIDRDGEFAADYGKRGPGDPFKLDKYEAWCLAKGRDFKKSDLARRITEYRTQQENPIPPPPPAVPVTEETPETEQTLEAGPPVEETAEEVVVRLRRTVQESKGRVKTPYGNGSLWQLWPTRIGVVLDSDTKRVQFFTSLEDMRAIVAILENPELL